MNLTQFLYTVIYQKNINFILRNFNYVIQGVLPAKIKLPPSGIITLKTDSGKIKMATNQTSYLTKVLFWYGYKEFEFSEIFESLSKKMNVFLDIGANIGYYSLIASKTNTKIRVHAFEPAMGPKFYLKSNIKLNNFQKNIILHDVALSEENGVIDFYEVESEKYTYITHNLSGEHNAGTKKTSRNFVKNSVNSTTLSAFIAQEKIATIDLIKIDTEGTEVHILKSGKKMISTHFPIVICETLFNTTENDLELFFRNLGYEFYNHVPNGLMKVNTIKRSVDNGIRNCFFVHPSKKHQINEYII